MPGPYAPLTADVMTAADHGLQGFVDHINRDDLGVCGHSLSKVSGRCANYDIGASWVTHNSD